MSLLGTVMRSRGSLHSHLASISAMSTSTMRCARSLCSSPAARLSSVEGPQHAPETSRCGSLIATRCCPMSQFGSLVVNLESSGSLIVQSLVPGHHPPSAPEGLDDRTAAFFEFFDVSSVGQPGLCESDILLKADENGGDVSLTLPAGQECRTGTAIDGCAESTQGISSRGDRSQPTLAIRAWIPFSCNVDVTGGSALVVRQMEGGTLAYAGQGDVFIFKSKMRRFDVNTAGVIVADRLQGNVAFSSSEGGIFVERFQSELVKLNTGATGPIDVESLQSTSAKAVSTRGDISISHFHGSVALASAAGSITIGSGDGELSANVEQHGVVSAHVSPSTRVPCLSSGSGSVLLTVDGDGKDSVPMRKNAVRDHETAEKEEPEARYGAGVHPQVQSFMSAMMGKGTLTRRMVDRRPSLPTYLSRCLKK